MTQDPAFDDLVKCRWNELRQNVLNNQRIAQWIDSTAQVMNESQAWNFTVWPIIGNYVWPNYYIGQSYQEEVDTLKWWIDKRGTFIQNSLPGNIANCSPVNIFQNNLEAELVVFPSPFYKELHGQFYYNQLTNIEIKLIDALGNTVLNKKTKTVVGINQFSIHSEMPLAAGVYTLQLMTQNEQWTRKVVASCCE
jgi:hypothetical protein